NQIRDLKLENKGVKVLYTEPLWDSAPLRLSFIEKADAVVRPEERASTGVLLVGHGQPHEWDLEFPTETEHEMRFREDVLRDFEAIGYKRENLSLAWMAFREPKVPEVVRDMADRGLKKMIFFSAAISAEAIHSQSDIPDLVAKAKASKRMEIINLGAWNDHPRVIEAIKVKIEEALRQAG
ncbi:MAG: hypothetical protein MUE65_05445, partial [Methanomassiliicoccales archaeon]|nr:hypothetical protein [Methanomassiliicoccales archaeon]